jgi:hypothetical protein
VEVRAERKVFCKWGLQNATIGVLALDSVSGKVEMPYFAILTDISKVLQVDRTSEAI